MLKSGDDMSRILVICEDFYLNNDANVNCVRILLNKLKSEGHHVIVFSKTFDDSAPEQIQEDGYTVRLFCEKIQLSVDRISKTLKSGFEKSFVFPLISWIAYRVGNILRKKQQLKAFQILHKEKPFDCILSVNQKLLNNYIAEYIVSHNKTIKWIIYFLDPHTYVYADVNRSVRVMAAEEKRWAKLAEGVILTNGIAEENSRHGFDPYKNISVLEVPLPNLMIKTSLSEQKQDRPFILLRYLGMFYDDIRNPEKLIEMLKPLDKEKYIVEFYGQSCSYLKKNYDDLPSCIRLMGSVDTEKCRELIGSADILINVSNTCPNQIPSKIFEYISIGKPILNLYFIDNDPSLQYLRKYPNVLNIKSDSLPDTSELEVFLNHRECLSSDILRQIYEDELSENVLQRITDFIESCVQNV